MKALQWLSNRNRRGKSKYRPAFLVLCRGDGANDDLLNELIHDGGHQLWNVRVLLRQGKEAIQVAVHSLPLPRPFLCKVSTALGIYSHQSAKSGERASEALDGLIYKKKA